MALIRDFIYLDLPRLDSFASQLFEGLPETRTRSTGHETNVGGEVRGRLPLVLEAAGNTKAVMSAASTVTSTIHHQLVSEVIAGLDKNELLWERDEQPPDGAFVLLRGQVQLSDPESLARAVGVMPDLLRHLQELSKDDNEPQPSRADRRAGRHRPSASGAGISRPKADAIAAVVNTLAPNTVRLRVIDGETTLATAVVERDKFVEELDRLVSRHGYLMGGRWHVLAQINEQAEDPFFAPEGEALLDVVEGKGLVAMKMWGDMIATGATAGLRITPLAVYREIRSRPRH